MMSKKDFIRIAYVLNIWKSELPEGFISDLCSELMCSNPRFDSVKFKEAINKQKEVLI